MLHRKACNAGAESTEIIAPNMSVAYTRLGSVMLHNLLIMFFGISLIFCLLWSFLCFLGMHYADNLYL